METIRETKRSRTVTITVPGNDYSLLRSITTRMGWTIMATPRRRKSGLELAMEDVRAGRVNRYSSSEELFAKLGI